MAISRFPAFHVTFCSNPGDLGIEKTINSASSARKSSPRSVVIQISAEMNGEPFFKDTLGVFKNRM
jgi:hypothetical protein